MSVPALRFKEFSGAWEEKKLGEISELITKGTTPKVFRNKGINYIKIQCFEDNNIDIEKCSFIDEEVHHNELKRSILFEGDILFAIAGATIGKCNLVTKNILPANTNQALAIIRLKNKDVLNFIFHFIRSHKMQKYIEDNIAGGAQPNLNLEQIGNFLIPNIKILEQTKIANFLTAVDEKISILNQKAALLSQYKKGVMQQIFSQELRFKDDDGQEFPEWEDKTLKDMLDIVIDNRGKTPPTENIGNPLLEVNSIGKKDINFKVVGKFVSDTTYHSWFRKHIKNGDILFSTVGATAQCSYFQDEQTNATIAQNIVGLRFKNIYNSLFMFYMLTEKKNNQKFKTIEMGAVQPSVKVSQMIHLFFSIPSLPEQTKIANFLTAIDEKITTNQTQLNALKQYKQGLLQQMFV